MRIAPSTWFRWILVPAGMFVAGCGSDYGGLSGVDATTGPGVDSSARDGGVPTDGTSVPDNAAPPNDVGATTDGAPSDQATPQDTSSPPDSGAPPDAPPGVDAADAAGDSVVVLDVARDTTGDGGADVNDPRDTRGDVSVVDASIDVPFDTGGADVSGQDRQDAAIDKGPTGPACGNGVKEGTEECDDGNVLDFDECSSLCTNRRACACCERANDPDVFFCQDLEGTVDRGPGSTGPDGPRLKADLCQEAYTCFLRTGCANDQSQAYPMMVCYCGAGNVSDSSSPPCKGDPTGPCKDVMVASLEVEETTQPEQATQVAARLGATGDYAAGGVATWWAGTIDTQACPMYCISTSPDAGPPSRWDQPCFLDTGMDGGTDGGTDAAADKVSGDSALMSLP